MVHKRSIGCLIRSEIGRATRPQAQFELASEAVTDLVCGMSQDVTRLFNALQERKEVAAEALLPLVYDELRALASAKMARVPAGQTLQATALVHESWLRIQNSAGNDWKNRAHFFSAAAEAMRRILVEQARRKSRIRHGGGKKQVNFDDVDIASEAPEDKMLLIHEALETLADEDSLKAEIVKLKFFAGLKNEDVGQIMGVSEKTVRRHWNTAKLRLFQIVSANKE